MRKYISVTPEVRNKLAQEHKVSRQAIWAALSFLTKSSRSEQIRREALAMGGEYREEDFIPNCQTDFPADGSIRQRFATGVEVTLVGNCMSLIVPGQEPEQYYDVLATSWSNVLERAQKIAEERMLKPVMQ